MPIALARFCAEGAIVCKSASEVGTSRAAPSPWKARTICKTRSVGARLHSVDASVKRVRPAKKVLLPQLRYRVRPRLCIRSLMKKDMLPTDSLLRWHQLQCCCTSLRGYHRVNIRCAVFLVLRLIGSVYLVIERLIGACVHK